MAKWSEISTWGRTHQDDGLETPQVRPVPQIGKARYLDDRFRGSMAMRRTRRARLVGWKDGRSRGFATCSNNGLRAHEAVREEEG